MLSRISSEPLMYVSSKHNYKTFSKSPPASLIHCIENVLSHSSGKWRDSLTMAALSFTNGCSEFHLYTIFNNSLISPQQQHKLSARKKDDTDTSLSFPSRTSLWYSIRVIFLLNN